MHTVFFSLRRADLRAIALQQHLLAAFGITPARYLMLFVIRSVGHYFPRGEKLHQRYWLRQSELRKQLGVSAVTVCKMLKSLEELGLVRREREFHDRRQIEVFLTTKAVRLLGSIRRKRIEPGYAYVAVHGAFGMRVEYAGGVKFQLDRMRRTYDDEAEFIYPWCKRTNYPERRWRPHVPFEAVFGLERVYKKSA